MIEIAITVTLVVLLSILSFALGLAYSKKDVSWFAFLAAWFGFTLGFSITATLPLDIVFTLCPDLSNDTAAAIAFRALWRALYWTVFVFNWLVFPVLAEVRTL